MPVSVWLLLLSFQGSPAPAGQVPVRDLSDLSLEELMNIEVTTVSKRPQPLSEAAAAVYVLTSEDLRRAGVTSIPEALRTVPGMGVARIDSNKWAISARGFNGRFANKLLVLIDGRSVYTPLFSGVYWDVEDLLLEDVERIEVIRGPGAALWGANAVNGIINIITKSTKDTRNGLVSFGGGTEDHFLTQLRYGSRLGEAAHFRVYGKYFDRDEGLGPDGTEGADAWRVRRGGLRLDWDPSRRDQLLFSANHYQGTAGGTTTMIHRLDPPGVRDFDGEADLSGWDLVGRWSRTTAGGSTFGLEVSFTGSERAAEQLGERRGTFDLDFQHQLGVGTRNRLIWGLGYRRTSDEIANSVSVGFDPDRRADDLFSGFLQDELRFAGDSLAVTVGSKYEHNDYTGFEIQPTGRIVWTPLPSQTIWGALSRAVRTPSRAEEDVLIRYQVLPTELGPALVQVSGSRDFDSESLVAYELGYRARLGDALTLDAAAFHHRYRNLRSIEPGEPFIAFGPTPYLVTPLFFDNKMLGRTRGLELSARLRISESWRLRAGYWHLETRPRLEPASRDTLSMSLIGDPKHQAFVHSSLDLGRGWELDAIARFVDEIQQFEVDAYFTLDARLGWRIRPGFELSLVLQDLLDAAHLEFGSTLGEVPTEVQRRAHLRASFRF